jgi:hypothetical protein
MTKRKRRPTLPTSDFARGMLVGAMGWLLLLLVMFGISVTG